MKLVFSKNFEKVFNKIKDQKLLLKIAIQIKKIQNNPFCGKPLKYSLKKHWSVRIPPFRIIYRVENNKIIIVCFDPRKQIYG